MAVVADSMHDPVAFIQSSPAPRVSRGAISGIVPFSGPYKSTFTSSLIAEQDDEPISCLGSVNCSYLSSAIAPNLLQLKQHAQSLAVLIREMTVSRNAAVIDAYGKRLPRAMMFDENESFDWLNDLSTPYTTDDIHHRQPLTSILNTIEDDPLRGEARNICPLQEVVGVGDKIQSHPWATHQNLIRHANELLERIDHEYSARGGLLSIFPSNMQKEDRKKAEETVLGQMIFWIQNLVQRIHHLERLYANSMDVLAREAIVPTETLSTLGATGRKGREVVYPQDRFVLANAGDDVWDFLNSEFERKEIIDTAVDQNYRSLGTTGEAIWAERGGREFAKGITAIDVYTRYYRLRDSPLKTVFVIPAYEAHPGTKVTREMEQQPTVVSVVKPVWPERLSVIEQKHKDDMQELKQNRFQLHQEMKKTGLQEQENHILNDENSKLREEKRILTEEKNRIEKVLREPVNKSKSDLLTKEISAATEMRIEAARVRAMFEKQMADAKSAKEKADNLAKEMQEARDAQMKSFAALAEDRKNEWEKQKKILEDKDKDIGRAAQEAIVALKKAWLQQMTESQILIDFVSDAATQKLLKNMMIPDHIITSGTDKAKKLFEALDKKIRNTNEEEITSSSSSISLSTKPTARAQMTTPPTTASWRLKGQGKATLGKQVTFPENLEEGPSSSSVKRPSEDQRDSEQRKKQRTDQGRIGPGRTPSGAIRIPSRVQRQSANDM